MTRKQLQALISAGVFSAALLGGAAYGDDSPSRASASASEPAPAQTPPPEVQPAPASKDDAAQAGADSSNQPESKHAAKTDKEAAQHGCGGAGGCSGH